MKHRHSFVLTWVLLFGGVCTPVSSFASEQLIVVVRHAEKPPAGLGQLTCQGLQRALRLPAWLASNFPPPDAIYAPDPSVRTTEIHGDGERYDYVRPLVTIAPTDEVPEWANSDYDTVFAFHIDWSGAPNLRFEVRQQELGALPDNCPAP